MMLFGPQLVIHTLGQFVRQSLEFVLSGGAAQDAHHVDLKAPLKKKYDNIVNIRVMFYVGLALLFVNIWAVLGLDVLNVLLLFPSLIFNISVLIGPFVMKTKPGHKPSVLAEAGVTALGWAAALVVYSLLTLSVMTMGVFGAFVSHSVLVVTGLALMAWVFDWNLGPISSIGKFFDGIYQKLEKAGKFKEQRLFSTLMRHFVIAMFVLLWFYLVPIPGLLIFEAGLTRVTIPLGSLIAGVTFIIGSIVASGIIHYLLGQTKVCNHHMASTILSVC